MAESLIRCVAAIFFILPGAATIAQSEASCSDPEVRSTCPASCRARCEADQDFLFSNVTWCAAASEDEEAQDSPICTRLLPGQAETGTLTKPPKAVSEGEYAEDPCAQFTKRSEYRLCVSQRKGGRPTCSTNVPELEDRAGLLTEQVRIELESYGDLLTGDFDNVSSRKALCVFSLEQLDQSYERAATEPANLRATHATAREIQDCQNEWQDYVRAGPVTQGQSDIIRDDAARDLEEQLAPLQGQLKSLNKSIEKLNTAAQIIDGLIGIHIDYCRPEGTPLQQGFD